MPVDCDLLDMLNRVQFHPCTSEDWNWEKNRDILNKIIENIRRLAACVSDAIDANKLRRFKLTADLALGASAAANLQITPSAWADDPDGMAITVHDRNGGAGRWQGVADVFGWCQLETGTDYSIIEIDEVAQYVVYQLDEHLTAANATATVVSFANGLDPGATAEVYDPLGIWKQWHRYGCLGIAVWIRERSRYETVNPQLVERRIRATLGVDWCEDAPDEPFAVISDPYRQGYYSAPLYEIDTDPMSMTFNQWILVTEIPIVNYLSNHGTTGDNIIVEGFYYHDGADINPDALKWEYELSEPHPIDYVAHVDFHAPCGLDQQIGRMYGQTCGASTSDPIDIPFDQWDLVETIYTFNNVDDPEVDPEFWVCQIRYTTAKYCTIRIAGSEADLLAADFTRREYMINWDVVNDVDDAEFDPPNYRIKYTTEYGYVLCFSDGNPYFPQDLRVIEVIDQFFIADTADEMDPECFVYATTTREVTFDLLGDAGTNKVVVVTTGHRIVTSVFVDGDDLKMSIATMYSICYLDEDDEVIDVFEDCPS